MYSLSKRHTDNQKTLNERENRFWCTTWLFLNETLTVLSWYAMNEHASNYEGCSPICWIPKHEFEAMIYFILMIRWAYPFSFMRSQAHSKAHWAEGGNDTYTWARCVRTSNCVGMLPVRMLFWRNLKISRVSSRDNQQTNELSCQKHMNVNPFNTCLHRCKTIFVNSSYLQLEVKPSWSDQTRLSSEHTCGLKCKQRQCTIICALTVQGRINFIIFCKTRSVFGFEQDSVVFRMPLMPRIYEKMI